MNQEVPNPENVQELADEIQEFIDNKREPDQIIKAQVKEISSSDNIITLELEEDFNFYRGAFVVVNGMSGSVQDKYSYVLKISSKEEFEFNEGDTVEIDSSRMNLIIDRLEKTINRIKENNLDKNNQKTLQFILGEGEPQYHRQDVHFKSETLNIPQKDAVKRTLSADNFHLIIGPPGTGKTYVINEIIKQLLSRDKLVLVTAWTNIAVDNILIKFKDCSSESILRIGSFNEVNPACQKFTLETRREQSNDWKEVKQLEKLIEEQKQSIRSLFNTKKIVKNEITELKRKREKYKEAIDSLMATHEQYRIKSSKYKPSNSKKNDELVNLELKCSKLSKESEDYGILASNLLNLAEWAESLPEQDAYNKLEGEIKKAQSQKIIKKITSLFRRKEYQKYLEELQNNEEKYEEMRGLYNDYWEERDGIEEYYIKLYGNYMGNPYNDSLKREIELVNLMGRYLPIQIAAFQNGIYNNQRIIYESYQLYITSLKEKADIISDELALLDVDTDLKIKEYHNISKEIKSLTELVEINENNKKLVLEYIDNEILSKSRLIMSTVISSAPPLLKEKFFDWVVMDEASQVASYMSLIPLLKTRRFVLVGDDQQLQPIDESQLSDHLNFSIFNRLLKNFPDNSTFLDTQYRMNEGLANLASELFYGGCLKTFPSVSQQTLNCTPKGNAQILLNPDVPITYLDTCNLEYLEDEVGNSCENSKEAELVAQLVTMLQEAGIPPSDIGVITPYNKQKFNIKNQLKDISKGVDVNTVYSFQGREKDVIILSFCNSKLGRLNKYIRKFIGNSSQINVALTRARKKLLLIGNSKILKQSKLLKELILLVGEENTVKCTDEHLNKVDHNE